MSASGYAGLTLSQPGGLFDSVYYIEKVVLHTRSEYQDIVVAYVRGFGKCLILDGWLQSCAADEYIYHEALVHPAMTLHPGPRRVLILGGGEGATLREVLRHDTVEEAVMVDIDPVVVEIARRHLGEWHRGAFEDPRARVVVMDGFRYVREARERGERFDVVVMDLTDPYGSEVAAQLYTVEAFKLIKDVMSSDGVLVVQAGCSTLFPEAYGRVEGAVSKVFRHYAEYVAWVPSFAYMNSFILASDAYDPRALEPGRVEERLRARGVRARFFNGERYRAMLAMAGLRVETGSG